MLGYAFILTHPGSPTVFYEHMFSWGLEKEITQLVSNVCFVVPRVHAAMVLSAASPVQCFC